MTTLAVVPGFCEGPRLARKFEEDARRAGFTITSNASEAEVVVAHSGGCYVVPQDATTKLVVLIGVPYWPGRPLVVRTLCKIRADFALHWREHNLRAWLNKTAWNAWYFWRMPANLRMLRAQKSNATFVPRHAKIVMIRNEDDAFCVNQDRTRTLVPNAAFYVFPGQHDDLWENPKPYIELIHNRIDLNRA